MDFIFPEDVPELELRDHPPAFWRPAVAEIAARDGLDGTLTPFASGSDIVWAAGSMVIKLTSPRWRWQLDVERDALAFVAGRLPVATPKVVAEGSLKGWPYLVMTRVPGVALGEAWARSDRQARLELAASLGRLIRALHDQDGEGPGSDWATHWADCRARVQTRDLNDGAPPHLAAEVPEFVEKWLVDESAAPVFLHTEVLDQHVLVHNGALSAMIDFADARMGPPMYELAAPVEFIFKGESGMLAAYLSTYGEAWPDTPEPERARRRLAWALTHR